MMFVCATYIQAMLHRKPFYTNFFIISYRHYIHRVQTCSRLCILHLGDNLRKIFKILSQKFSCLFKNWSFLKKELLENWLFTVCSIWYTLMCFDIPNTTPGSPPIRTGITTMSINYCSLSNDSWITVTACDSSSSFPLYYHHASTFCYKEANGSVLPLLSTESQFINIRLPSL